MKTGLAALFVTVLGAQAFASSDKFELTYNERTHPAAADFCSQKAKIELVGNTMTLSLNPELGADFNIDSSLGDVVLTKVNKGSVVNRSKSSAHGEKSKTTIEATFEDRILEVESVTRFSYGIIPTGKAYADLKITFTSSGFDLEVTRGFNAFGSSSDWESSQFCRYKLQ